MSSRRITVQTKIFGLSAVLLAFLVVLGLTSISKLGGVADQAETTFVKATVPLGRLGEVRALVNENRVLTSDHILESDAASRAEIKAKIDRNAKTIIRLLEEVRPSLVTEVGKQQFAKLTTDIAAYKKARAQVLERSADPAVSDQDAYAYNKANAAPAAGKVNEDFSALFTTKVNIARANNEQITSTYDASRTLVIALLLAAVALGASIAFVIARSIRRNLAVVVERLGMLRDHCATELGVGLRRMAEGDLTYEVTPVTPLIETWSNDEVGDVAQSANAIRERLVASIESYNASRAQLGQLVSEVGSAAGSVSAGSQQMASTSEETGRAVSEIAQAVGDVAEGAQRQVATIEGARAAASEVTAVTEDSARTAQSTADAAEQAREIAAAGATAIGQATEAMAAVRDASEQATAAIRALGAKSDQIGGIVDTIGGIAEQTNLLALNAAIEAARAGDQGRGFAVVADEVRKLAEESQQAARSIASLIAEIQAETGRAIDVVESGGQRTNEGAATVEQAREAFQAIGSSVEDVSARVTQIAAAIEQVAASATTMRDDMTLVAELAESSSASTQQVSAATQQTSASAQEIAASAQELAHTAEQLEQLVGRFQLA